LGIKPSMKESVHIFLFTRKELLETSAANIRRLCGACYVSEELDFTGLNLAFNINKYVQTHHMSSHNDTLYQNISAGHLDATFLFQNVQVIRVVYLSNICQRIQFQWCQNVSNTTYKFLNKNFLQGMAKYGLGVRKH
jgi:hypothetical protein